VRWGGEEDEAVAVRLVIATCSVEYAGRLRARLASAKRLLVVKADGSVSVHSDGRAYKPLNWMNPPCELRVAGNRWTVTNARGETLTVDIEEVHAELGEDLGVEPGLEKDGVEAQIQELLAANPGVLGAGFTLLRREYPTDIGPVDLLCRDAEGVIVAVEVKRRGEIDGVEQLVRYVERLDLDGRLRPVRGLLVAQQIRPQAEALAAARGLSCLEVDYDALRQQGDGRLTLF
jgi:RecB family endonuclease NucS